jgi:hypothetical protein
VDEPLVEAINQVLDIEAYNAEVEAEKEDAKNIVTLREKAKAALAGIMEEPS